MTSLDEAHSAETLRSGAIRVLNDVLEVVRTQRGLDFGAYRRGTLERRLLNRMVAARVSSADAYLSLLHNSEDEVDRIASNLTIKVSRFYRNASVFEALRDHAVPALRERYPHESLRVWSAGCATGEEAWTLAMILGEDRVIATDIDIESLAIGARGRYASHSLIEAPATTALFPMASDPGVWSVSDELRRRVTFLRHDLAAANGPPGETRYHLICCRNVLIYFERDLQVRTLNLLVASLLPEGVLCLGEAEWPGAVIESLEVLDRRQKIFRLRKAMEIQ
ncbi:MAG TPA: protein-glutamate O-methyltransferase CheR [Thermoanaerobaculia bacterium]